MRAKKVAKSNVGKIETEGDSLAVTAFVLNNRKIISFLPFDDSFRAEYMAYDPVNGWVPVDGRPYNPSQGIFDLYLKIGKMLAMGAFVYVSVAVGAAGGVFAVWVVGEASAYASVAQVIGAGVFDIAFAGGEAGVMFYINGNEDAAWNTFYTGVIFAGIGSAGELVLKNGVKAFLSAEYGDRLINGARAGRNFDLLVKVQKESGEVVEVSLKEFSARLKSQYGLTDAEVKVFMHDLQNGKIARAILVEPDLVHAWLVLRKPSDVVFSGSTVNLSGVANVDFPGCCGPVAIAVDFRHAGNPDMTALDVLRTYNDKLFFPMDPNLGGTYNPFIIKLYDFLGKKNREFVSFSSYDELTPHLKRKGIGTRGLVSANDPGDTRTGQHIFNVRVVEGANNQPLVIYIDGYVEGPANINRYINGIRFLQTD